jgi:hypothetical protein
MQLSTMTGSNCSVNEKQRLYVIMGIGRLTTYRYHVKSLCLTQKYALHGRHTILLGRRASDKGFSLSEANRAEEAGVTS